jgi:hypothetical protein
MSVELPGAPQLYQAPVPEEMRRHYRSVVNYLYNDEALFVILSCNTSNRGPVKSPNLRDFTAGFVDGFKKSRRLSDINLTTIPDTLCRILLSGSYKRDDVWFEFEGFTQAKGENIWIVMLSYARGDGETKSLAKYASESVSLE